MAEYPTVMLYEDYKELAQEIPVLQEFAKHLRDSVDLFRKRIERLDEGVSMVLGELLMPKEQREVEDTSPDAEKWRAAFMAKREELARYRLRGKAEHGHAGAKMNGLEIVPQGLAARYNRLHLLTTQLLQALGPGESDDDVEFLVEEISDFSATPDPEAREVELTRQMAELDTDD